MGFSNGDLHPRPLGFVAASRVLGDSASFVPVPEMALGNKEKREKPTSRFKKAIQVAQGMWRWVIIIQRNPGYSQGCSCIDPAGDKA